MTHWTEKLSGAEILELLRLRLHAARLIGLSAVEAFFVQTRVPELTLEKISAPPAQKQTAPPPKVSEKPTTIEKRPRGGTSGPTRRDRRLDPDVKERGRRLLGQDMKPADVYRQLKKEFGDRAPKSSANCYGWTPLRDEEAAVESISEILLIDCLRDQVTQISEVSCLQWQATWRAPSTDARKAWDKLSPCRNCDHWVRDTSGLPIKPDPHLPVTTPKAAIERIVS